MEGDLLCFQMPSINSTAARFSPKAYKASALAMSTKYETRPIIVLLATVRKTSIFILSSGSLTITLLNVVTSSLVYFSRSVRILEKIANGGFPKQSVLQKP